MPFKQDGDETGLFEVLKRINQVLDRAIPLIVPIGVVFGGIVLPKVFIGLRPLVLWFFVVITLSGSLNLRVRELGRAVSSPLPVFIFIFCARILLPLMVFSLSSLIFSSDPEVVSGYVLLYTVPTAVTGIVWVSVFKGDTALSLALILLDAILAPIVVPGTVHLLLGASISLNMTGMVLSLIYMVVIPTIVGVTLNELSRGKIPAMVSPWISPFSKVCIFLMIAANSAAASPQMQTDNPLIWIIIAVCIGFSVMGFICSKLMSLAGKLKREKQVALFFACSLRNTSSAMTLAIEFFPGSAALPAVLGIMFQQMTAAVMGRLLLGKIGGNAASKVAS